MTNKLLLENLSSVTSGVDLAQTCEVKLLSCDQKMQKLEAELCILEAKLNSIPGLEEVQTKPAERPSEVTSPADETDKPPEEDLNSSDQRVLDSPSTESEVVTPSAAKVPELERFTKMVQFGVPVPAVKLKMQQDGFDPNLLDS